MIFLGDRKFVVFKLSRGDLEEPSVVRCFQH